MKSLKTFNLSTDCITKIKRQPNQSAFVEKAIWDRLEYLRSKQKKEASFSAADMTSRQLMWALQQKEDCPAAIRAIILDIMVNNR